MLTWYQTITCYDPCPFYWLRLHTHRWGYVTRSHMDVSIAISSCSSYVICKIL